MLVVSNKYESIDYILENTVNENIENEEYSIGADFTLDQVVQKLCSIKNANKQDSKLLTKLAKHLYNVWNKQLNKERTVIPFRFDTKLNVVKIYNDRDVSNYADSIQDNAESLGISDLTKRGFHLGGLSFVFGAGSLFGNRSKSGLDYEDIVRDEVIQIIKAASTTKSISKIKSLIDESAYHLLPIYESGALNNAISLYKKDNSLDLNLIVLKHSGTTKRNANGEICDENFNLNTGDIENILKASGKIIADVIVNTKNPVYISVKKKDSQLSTANCKNVMENNYIFRDALNNNLQYSSIQRKLSKTAYGNFCRAFGIDGRDLYNKYFDLSNGNTVDSSLKLVSSYYGAELGAIFQKLVGGNYWYVKPNHDAIFIEPNNLNLVFNREKIKFEQRGIIMEGSIAGIKASLKFRTAEAQYDYPYRLFPIIDVNRLMSTLFE